MFKLTILFDILFFSHYVTSQETSSWPIGTYVPNICVCGSANQCSYAGAAAETDGSGIIQGRILTNGKNPNSSLGTNSTICQPVNTGTNLLTSTQSSCDSNYMSLCCPSDGYTCGNKNKDFKIFLSISMSFLGIRYPPIPNAPIASSGQAAYGAYPFQAILMAQDFSYISGGVLINQFYVLSTAHKLINASQPLKVRFGDWDASDTYEPLPNVEINGTYYIHPSFNSKNLQNDISIVRLQSAVNLGQYPTIGSICLPNITLSGLRCWVSGYGKNGTDSTGRYQRILKEVDVPLIDATTCAKNLRTVLGNTFSLDKKSFLCAGGESGKDSCIGDGGSPLSCFVGTRFYLVGLSACGQAGLPSVYVNIQSYIPWIQNMTATLNQGSNSTLSVNGSQTTPSVSNVPTSSSTNLNNPTSTVTTSVSIVSTAKTSISTSSATIVPTVTTSTSTTSTIRTSAQTTSITTATTFTSKTGTSSSISMPSGPSTLDTCFATKALYDFNGNYLKTVCIVANPDNYPNSNSYCTNNNMQLWTNNNPTATTIPLQIFLEEIYGYDSGPWWINGTSSSAACNSLSVTNRQVVINNSDDCTTSYISICEYKNASLPAVMTKFAIDTSICGLTTDITNSNSTYLKTACLVAYTRNYTTSDYVCKINGMTLFTIDNQSTQNQLNSISENYFDINSGIILWINGMFTNSTCARFSGVNSPFSVSTTDCGYLYWSYCQYSDQSVNY
ncbi:hypothetical protein PVAND_014956 [Polypedilum vanderplanki]|uniref:Peptidase S1 domain-containing protein n=1 Tax=Polypedilum vanderplanki TaxID=319348 RepID=A0A9J6BB91_POLVA|nr:hypothetical protein PVAND_014956 [Polypedilum vanderplanki]